MAQAQQCIDAQIPVGGCSVMNGDICFFYLAQSVQDISRRVFARTKGEPNVFSQGVQMQCGMQTIAAVVTRPTSDPNALGMGRPSHRQLCHRLASALHQACMHAVVEPLAAAQQAARAAEARKAAATRVDFFTMATMR